MQWFGAGVKLKTNMKDSKANTVIGILAFIWCNVATNKLVAVGAALVGLLYTVNSFMAKLRERE